MITIQCERNDKTDVWVSPEDIASWWPTKAWHEFSTSSWIRDLQTWPGASKYFRVVDSKTPVKKGWYLIFANTVNSFVNHEGLSCVSVDGHHSVNAGVNLLVVFVHEGMKNHDLRQYQKNLSTLLNNMTITRPKSVHVLVGTPLDLDQEHSDDRVQWYYYPWSAGIAQQCALTKMPGGVPKPQYRRDAAYRYLTLSGRSHPRRDLLLKCLQYRDLLGHGLISRPMKNNAWQDINLDELDDIHDNDFKVWLDQTPGLPVHDYINCNHELTGIKRHWPGSQLLYQQCQWEIVNETQGAAHGNVYLSVNIFRSLLMGMPFVVNGSPGTLSALRDLGFQTFDSIINESYDTILDPVSRILAVTTEIQKICDGSTVIDSDAVTQILIHNQTLALSLPHLQRVHDLLNHV